MAGAGIDKALGISPQVLQLRMQRMNLLTTNIANANTPDYKARDIDFRASLEAARDAQASMSTTNARHIPLAGLEHSLTFYIGRRHKHRPTETL